MAARQMCNLGTFNPTRREFDLKPIEKFVAQKEEETGFKNPYFGNFRHFYLNQSLLMANAGDIETCSLWNRVVGNLPNILYCREGSNEINSGFINLVRIFETIFGLELSPLPQTGLNAKKTWVEESLSHLLSILNPSYTYVIELEGTGFGHEVIGDALVTVKKSVDGEDLFSFNIHSNLWKGGGHMEVNELTLLMEQKTTDYTSLIQNHRHVLRKDTAEESVLLLLSPDLQQDIHPLYKIYSQPSFNIITQIKFLKSMAKNYKSWAANYPSWTSNLSLIQSMVKNVVDTINWEEEELRCKLTSALLSMANLAEFRSLIGERTRGLRLTLEEISEHIKNFQNLEVFELMPMANVDKFFLTDDFKNIKILRLQTSHASIAILAGLENTPNLEEIEFSRLAEITFPKRLEKLKTMLGGDSGIQTFENLEHLPSLEKLDLSNTKMVSKLVLTPQQDKLEILYLQGSGLSALTGLGHAKNLKELDLENALNIVRLKIDKENKDLVLKIRGSGIKGIDDIEGFEHLDPGKVFF